jgi:hypothetical protein
MLLTPHYAFTEMQVEKEIPPMLTLFNRRMCGLEGVDERQEIV